MNRLSHIDINCDVGEISSSDHQYVDDKIMPLITSCNIACGGHAGDAVTMRKTIRLAIKHEVNIGAHPSYPDPANFGRKSMPMSADELIQTVTKQVAHAEQIALEEGASLTHIKPHGALYNDMANDEEIARQFFKAVRNVAPSAYVFCLANSHAVVVAHSLGIRVVQEVFGDRKYAGNNKLLPRTERGAVLKNPVTIQQHIVQLINGVVHATDGKKHPIAAETICVHSDTPNAVAIIQTIRKELETNNVEIVAYK